MLTALGGGLPFERVLVLVRVDDSSGFQFNVVLQTTGAGFLEGCEVNVPCVCVRT